MIRIFKKNRARQTQVKTIGFIPETHLSTNNELTNFLAKEEKFIWDCNYSFGKLNFLKVNFRNNGDETYLDIDENTKLFTRFFTTPGLKQTDPYWFEKVGSMGLCFVFKGKPVLQIDTHTYDRIKSIKLSVSNTILHFIDGQFDICGQFGYGNGDRNFYFKKYNEKTGNIFLTHDDLLNVVKKCFNILHNVANSNYHIFKEKEKEIEKEIKEKDIDIHNVSDFISNK